MNVEQPKSANEAIRCCENHRWFLDNYCYKCEEYFEIPIRGCRLGKSAHWVTAYHKEPYKCSEFIAKKEA